MVICQAVGNGIRNGATKKDGDRTEVLWSNRPFPTEQHLFSDRGGHAW